MTYEFKGDNKALVSSITALLALDAKGALVPHGIGEMARQLLEASSVRLAEQQHGKPVALPQRKDDPNPENYGPFDSQLNEDCMEVIGWNACLDEIAKLGPLYRHPVQGEPVAWINFPDEHNEIPFVTWRSPDEQKYHNALMGAFDTTRMCIVPLYTHTDPAEVELLREGIAKHWKVVCDQRAEIESLRDQLAKVVRSGALTPSEHEALEAECCALSASAEPSVPKCETCKGNGVIGWRRGQTAESYEEGESPCEDCNATGYAHSNGMPVSGACTTCNGLGTVPDGGISGLDGAEFENGPIECIKDCPDCKPSAPTVTDEPTDLATWKRRAIEAESKLRTYDPQVVELGEQAMQALLAEPKPSEVVLTKCKLCDQLQADLTERDEQNDQVRQLLQHMVSDYRSVAQAGYDCITALGSDCDSVAKMLADNPNYQKALAVLMPDLESRPEERGSPETEPCSACGTPGWTGACNKCVPY